MSAYSEIIRRKKEERAAEDRRRAEEARRRLAAQAANLVRMREWAAACLAPEIEEARRSLESSGYHAECSPVRTTYVGASSEAQVTGYVLSLTVERTAPPRLLEFSWSADEPKITVRRTLPSDDPGVSRDLLVAPDRFTRAAVRKGILAFLEAAL